MHSGQIRFIVLNLTEQITGFEGIPGTAKKRKCCFTDLYSLIGIKA